METEYKTIKGYEDYLIGSDGSITSFKNGNAIELSPCVRGGYYAVNLRKNGRTDIYDIHRLVALHFLENTDIEKTQVHHKDFNKFNNDASNLMWVSPEEHRALHTGKKKPERKPSKYELVQCIDTGKIYNSFIDAHNDTGASATSIYYCCLGTYKTAGKLHWQYVEEAM